MIVSIAIAVLPVCLSPMINSLWPRPIGVIASIIVIPVAKEVSTDFLVITPGAITSIGRNAVVLISPFPSIGWPKALITLPSIASPAGTFITSPVDLTTSPSLIKEASPSKTAPTESLSRFIAIPKIPFGNSNNSPNIALSRPYTVAIPSPTETTLPTLEESTLWR